MGKKSVQCLGMLFCFLFLIGWSPLVWGRDLRVPEKYPRIQQAVDEAKEGDRIMVAEGTYFEHVRLKAGITLEGGWNRPFTRRDIKKYSTVIDAEGEEGWGVLAADKTVLDGFTIRNASQVKTEEGEYGSGIYCLSVKQVIIRDNTFYQNEPSGIYAGDSQVSIVGNHVLKNFKAGIHLDKGSTLVIKSNIIEQNKDAGISSQSKIPGQIEAYWNRIFQNGKAGVDCQNAGGKVYNNIIYGNREGGVRACITPLEVVNNTIVDNGQGGVIAGDQSIKITIKNNIIAFNVESGIMSAQQGYDHNLLFANAGTGACDADCLPCIRGQHAGYEDEESFRKIGEVIADPMFADTDGHDYHLLPGSPAIDAGDKDTAYADKNFPPSLGSERNDIGAYGGPFAVQEERTGDNHPPRALAEAASPVYVGEVVRLDATKSQDPDGDSLKYNWTLLSAPSGSKTRIFRPENPKTSFRADLEGEYRVGLQLTDRWGARAESALVVSVQKNHPPSAYAGEDMEEVSVGDTITLSGDISTDDDSDPLSYKWQVVACPRQSGVRLSDTLSASPTFTIDKPGCYLLQLVVNDGQVDSPPDDILINTVYEAPDRIRHVPAEYPTIQSAVDAARAGDTILVQAGTYRENVYVEKSIDLKGVGWPVIDGGSKPGNVDTVKITSLGDQAGRIEGFVITGGGTGPLAHGLSAWDSSPTICNNQFVRNPNNGIGLHGRKLLTEKTEVYGNLVYGNKGGIGNGRGGCAHIHHNYVFHNRVFGIGCRGFSSPRIEHNYIFENSIGIGMREVSSPQIIGNYIYYNNRGISLSPVSTVKASVAEDIVICNNLIFQNLENGLMVTSFNLSRVIVTNNTIDSNGREKPSRRGGGIILGWPWPGGFEAVVQNNIVTNNGGVGVLNYPGEELQESVSGELDSSLTGRDASRLQQRPGGVKLTLAHNNLWNNKENYQGCQAGEGDFSKDPLFTAHSRQPWEKYFLSQVAAGQSQDSPCLDAAPGDMAAAASWLAGGSTTRGDLRSDRAALDLGFHYLPDDCGKGLPALVQEKVME